MTQETEQFLIRMIETCEDAGMRKAFAERLAARARVGKGELELVMQQTDDDCVPCSLAMLTGLKRQEVLDKVGNLYVAGKGLSHTWRALEALGYSSDDFIGFSTSKDATDYEMDLTLHLAWNRRALISVPSLNHKGGAHMVYVEGNRVFDPSNKKRYTEWTDLRPYEVIIFNDAALSAQTKPVEPTEFEIALKAREMEKEYNEQFGSDAIRPDFIASAKLALSESSEAKPVVANQQDAYNTPTALNMSKPVEVGELVEVIAAANRTVTRNGIQLSVPRSLLCAIAALDALIAIGAVRVK